MPDRKMIATDPNDWKVYDKLAKALSKQVGFKVYVNNAVKIAMQEYIATHPELQIKVN